MKSPEYVVGIDLGTTHCAVAFTRLSEGPEGLLQDFPIAQLERPGQVAVRPLLPSCLYAAADGELPPGSARLPWGEGDSTDYLVGEFARWQGARVPGRLISSSKSWLSHDGVDRSAAILPWGAPPEVRRISPTEAAARLLGHLRDAWNESHPAAVLADQEVVITVPASFDEVARELTVAAARQAGIVHLTLVEEPQAAFYDFTDQHRRDLARALDGVRLLLVVDIGGGTSDFTLIRVETGPNGPILNRAAVGEHLMLGGDNMDAALARRVESGWLAGGRKLSAAQWIQLVHAARAAKETLLGSNPPERVGLSVLGEGSRLLGNTLSAEVRREEIDGLIHDGFFPACDSSAVPQRGARTALQEMGLRYASDPGITRHLAAFLRQHAAAGWAALGAGSESAGEGKNQFLPRPDAVLLNGGVFNSGQIARRLQEVISSWWPEAPPVNLLPHTSLDRAVARGAAQYGRVRRGLGRRIGGGTAHAFYVGLAAAGEGAPSRAVCLIPRGQEEGVDVDLDRLTFDLTLGQPVQFPLYATASDRVDAPGQVVVAAPEEGFRPLPPIQTVLKSRTGASGRVPVHLRARITEVGTLELWCVADAGGETWRLEFAVRSRSVAPDPGENVNAVTPAKADGVGIQNANSNTGAVAAAGTGAPEAVGEGWPKRFPDAQSVLERAWGKGGSPSDPKEIKQLGPTLEQLLGPRESWRLPVLRKLWEIVLPMTRTRRRTADHERAFYQWMGYTLRPGFGHALDSWRTEQLFPCFREGVTHRTSPQVWNEFWILWRRIAGGLTAAQHAEIWETLRPHLERKIVPAKAKGLPKPKGVQLEGLDEMARLAASLEHLPVAAKLELGGWILERLRDPALNTGPWAWALGRLGARELLFGGQQSVVPPEAAGGWLTELLRLNLGRIPGAAFAAAQMARRTEDRLRDLAPESRRAASDALRTAGASPRWVQFVEEVVVLDAADEAQAFGDSLPLGLTLRS